MSCAETPSSALEEELDGVAEEVLDLLAQLPVVLELGVGVEDLLGGGAGLDHDRFVLGQAPELEVGPSRLALTEDLPGPADREVALGELEAVRRLDHRLHARLPLG